MGLEVKVQLATDCVIGSLELELYSNGNERNLMERWISDCRFFFHSPDQQVISDSRRIVGDSRYIPSDHKELCNRIFITCYMGSENSSQVTKQRAANFAAQIGRFE